MVCSKCGAKLREKDKFCPECGSAIRKGGTKKRREDEVPDYFANGILYDETLFRDGILEEQQERRSHALLVTLTALLAIAVLVFVFLIGFFFLKKNSDENGTQTQQYVEGNTDGGAGDIVVVSDGGGDDTASDSQTGAGTAADTPGQQDADSNGQENIAAQTEETPLQTEKETQKQTEAVKKELKIDTERIENIMSGSEASQYGIFIYDLESGQSCIVGDGEEPMYASATISLPILYTAAVLLDSGKITMDDQITYNNSIGGRGEANPEQRHGYDFPLSYYLRTMLRYSDNNCINCLIDFLTLDVINKTCHDAGFKGIDLQRKIVAEVTDGSENYVSARDTGMMMADFYSGKFKTINREFVTECMAATPGDYMRTSIGLSSALINGNPLFLNQNGRGDTRYSEAAVVVGPGRSYAISVTLYGPYGFSFDDQVAAVSTEVWNSVTDESQTEEAH